MIDPSQQSAYRELMTRVVAGDQTAFSALYDRLSGPLFSLAFQMLGDRAEAEDALQEVCLQLWRRAANYDASKSSVFTWAVMMTRSKAIDRLRARGRRQRVVAGSIEEVEKGPELASEAATQRIPQRGTMRRRGFVRRCARCLTNRRKRSRWHFFAT